MSEVSPSEMLQSLSRQDVGSKELQSPNPQGRVGAIHFLRETRTSTRKGRGNKKKYAKHLEKKVSNFSIVGKEEFWGGGGFGTLF